MWEVQDAAEKDKVAAFARQSGLVTVSGRAERDLGQAQGISKAGILEAIVDHISCGYVVYGDQMRNGDLAYIFKCFVGRHRWYIKLKFTDFGQGERMHVFSAHADR